MPEFETTYQEEEFIDIDAAITEELSGFEEHENSEENLQENINTEVVSFKGINQENKETEKSKPEEENNENEQQEDTSNKSDDENNKKTKKQKEEKKEDTDSSVKKEKKEIIFPKEFEYLVDVIKTYNNTLSLSKDKKFIQQALKEGIRKEIANSSKKIAEKFANDTIEELSKMNYFQKTQEYNQMKFIENIDIENCPKLNIVSVSKEELKEKLIFDINEFYKIYAEISKGNKEYEDFFNLIFNINVYVEDFFEL